MPIKIFDSGSGQMREANSRIYSSYWRQAAVWVYSNGAWRRTYDPTDENLLTNSRWLNGTDYYTFMDNSQSIGAPPPGWTFYENTEVGQTDAYAFYSGLLNEFGRQYTFKTVNSRLFMTGHVYVRAGEQYNASVLVHSINVGWGQQAATLTIHDQPNADINQFIKITTPFKAMGDIAADERIFCRFTALKDCIVEFNIGIGTDYNASGQVVCSRPQVSRTIHMIDYMPTPKDVVYKAVYLMNSYFLLDHVINTHNGTHRFEASIKLNSGEVPNNLILVGRNDGPAYSEGIGIDVNNRKLFIMKKGVKEREITINTPIPMDTPFGIGLWFDVQSSYVTNIRLHINGDLVAVIPTTTTILGNIDALFGIDEFKADGVIVEQFSLGLNGKTYTFNVEEGSGNKTTSIRTVATATMQGTESQDFAWMTVVPVITVQPQPVYQADYGYTIQMSADVSDDYESVQWRTQYGEVQGATDKTLTVYIDQDYDFGLMYYAVFKTKFGSSYTDMSQIRYSGWIFDPMVRILSEDSKPIWTEADEYWITDTSTQITGIVKMASEDDRQLMSNDDKTLITESSVVSK